ncbi:MAG TPA: NUDIX hydrolase N-terminal domain-containing protein [Jiangellales bacterium]|nr:NUDIX hydrolase N-terminal domain-containing protein [Jiangellales bacterium]
MTRSVDLLSLGRELQSIAQAGLTYGSDPYDLGRYARLRDLAADLLAAGVPAEVAPSVRTGVAEESGYLTPKVDLRAAVRRADGALLMVRERVDGGWTMPGGWADVDESVAEGAVREVAEEAGVAVRARGLLGLYERERRGHPPIAWHCLKAVVACEPVGGGEPAEPVADGVEVSEAAWFAPDSARGLALSAGRTSPWLLDRVLRRLADPWPPAGLTADLD